MKIYLAADHAGYNLKQQIKKYLGGAGHEVKDFGAHEEHSTDDYPDYIHPLAQAVASDPDNLRGIIFGGSGQGEAMVANRYRGIRAAVYYGGPEDIVLLSRRHNNANVLSIGARFVDGPQTQDMIKSWLETPFNTEGDNERHLRRINKIDLT